MKLGAKIDFVDGFPDIDDMRSQLAHETGLEIEFIELQDGFDVQHPAFDLPIELYYSGDSIFLGSYLFGKQAYIFYALVNALTELGGDCDYPEHTPDWSRNKWNDVESQVALST